ncbi:ABC-2 type transport system permease protein [Rhodopseudomonas thermotolerans]|uniref:ABC-2 type transport system permease protein n=2 Tax=Rhodopseudomonas TaxID=1073 RepID=A0A336JJG1_9BRAD|nr:MULTISPECIES: ABC transporter permease [Rhodopseudomonas]RED38372.1 ABC-2 type transport system permease protein [Rhodopseudomonas pentothenatexigens]REG05957.1 ABC-2 type transport system permease protein [Rhodopseudomonas thermotolerans]SSW89825.1 ABC-2 type transport system permease protein [Rhodopseudomonas pentothenatexigens]
MGFSMLRHIYRLTGKELRSLWADPILLGFIVYVFSAAVYTIATGAKFEVEAARVAVVDEDHSELSRRIAAALLPPLFRTAEQITPAGIDTAMDNGRYVFVLEIPPKFESDALSGKTPTVQIDVDATAMAIAGNGAVDIQNIVLRETAAYLRKDSGTSATPVNLVMHTKFNPNLNSAWFTSVMQVINNIATLSIILTGAALIRERERGTIEHLLVMPVNPLEIMLSKIIANGAVIVAAALLSLQFMVKGVLGVPIAGSVPLFTLGMVLFMFSVTALGLLLATYARTMPQFGLLAIPVIVILYLLSGATTPVETMPAWLQFLMQFTPNTQFVSFSQAVLYRGAGFDLVWPQMLALLAIGGVTLGICRVRFAKTISAQD